MSPMPDDKNPIVVHPPPPMAETSTQLVITNVKKELSDRMEVCAYYRYVAVINCGSGLSIHLKALIL